MTRYFLGAFVRLWTRLAKGGIDKWERGRARSIAAASAPLHGEELPPEDQALADAHHEIVVEWRTAEQPTVPAFTRKHLYRPPTPRQLAAMRARIAAPAQRFAADPLSAPLATELSPAVELPGPAPAWRLESFTESWTAADLARILANAKETAK
jgi:hypothetical protein